MHASGTGTPGATSSRFSLAAVAMAPKDPILGVTEAFVADTNPKKVNLGVGVYYDDEGKVPLLECVRRAERQLLEAASPYAYLPIDGLADYDRAVQALVFGPESAAVRDGRVVTVQALGGTGGLKVGADFLKRLAPPDTQVWISRPSWENHRALFETAGFLVHEYPYYDPHTRGVDFDAMLASLASLPPGSIVVLHACCHNPTGVDLTSDQWRRVFDTVARGELIPFLDLAYQGLGDGLDADAFAVRLFSEAPLPVLLSSSFSKSFSLYGERVGALSVVAGDGDQAGRVRSQLKRLVRTNYSNPPDHGARIVATVLTTPELRALWERELGGMCERIKRVRRQLVERIRARVPNADLDFVLRQRGMFSYSGLSPEQVARLRRHYSIYLIESGRMCVAALNPRNLDYVADAVAEILGS